MVWSSRDKTGVPPTSTWKALTSIADGFTSSLLVATGIKHKAPFRAASLPMAGRSTKKGQPMTRVPWANALYPNEIVERWGADLLRLWVASVEYQADVKMSERVMTQLSEAYRKIRNTFRFALSNLADFDPSREALPNEQLDENGSLDARAHRARNSSASAATGSRRSTLSIASITLSTISALSI